MLLLALSGLSLVEAIFTRPSLDPSDISKIIATLYQVKAVFVAGILLVCIIIVHNWFKEKIIGTISAFWLTSIYI